jgi:dTDP-glucose pyrophosphorylase
MNSKINVIILAAGSDQALPNDGFPVCLTEIDTVPLLQRIIISVNEITNSQLITCFTKNECHKYHLDSIVKILNEQCKVVKIPAPTAGAACTALLCAGDIDNEDELLIINGNELIDIRFNEVVSFFRKKDIDAGVVVFRSIHPRYSYVRKGSEGLINEASEKRPISEFATTGFYWYKHGKDFVASAKSMIKKDARVNGVFYICPVFNEMILVNKRIDTFEINEGDYYPIKDIKQMQNLELKFDKKH